MNQVKSLLNQGLIDAQQPCAWYLGLSYDYQFIKKWMLASVGYKRKQDLLVWKFGLLHCQRLDEIQAEPPLSLP